MRGATTNPGSIASVQMLRGIAALMVVLFHAYAQLHNMTGFNSRPMAWMSSGVDIFFIISGFIMWVTTERAPQRSAGDFFLNRLMRIVPLYWIVTIAAAAVLLLRPGAAQSSSFDASLLIRSLLFLPGWNEGAQDYVPVVVPGWTLNLELFFYILFALALAVSRGRRAVRFAVVAALFAASVGITHMLPDVPGEARFYGKTMLLEFPVGMALGWLYLSGRVRLGLWGWAVAASGFALLYLVYTLAPWTWSTLPGGLPAALVVGGAVLATPIRSWLFEKLGDISYSLYLTHGITLSILAQLWRAAGLTEHEMIFLLCACITSIIGGAVSFFFIETPLLRLTKAALERGQRGKAPRRDTAPA